MTQQPKGQVAAIVVAAGSGVRLGREVPKAAIEIGGVPMVRRAVQAMLSGGVDYAVVVAPEAWVERFAQFFVSLPDRVKVIPGGVLRQDSVRLALSSVSDAELG